MSREMELINQEKMLAGQINELSLEMKKVLKELAYLRRVARKFEDMSEVLVDDGK
jgi:division protein CdvB (Snf7/Vps24/ESCRT-III family)